MQRDDLFTTIHKGLRHAIFEVNVRAGATDYADAAAPTRTTTCSCW